MALEDESTIDPNFAPKRSAQRPRHTPSQHSENPHLRYNVARQGPWEVRSGESSYVDAARAPVSRDVPRKSTGEGRRQEPIPKELLKKLLKESADRQAAEEEAARKANAESIAHPHERRISEAAKPAAREAPSQLKTFNMPKHMPAFAEPTKDDKAKGRAPTPNFDVPEIRKPTPRDSFPREKVIIRAKDGRETIMEIPTNLRRTGPNPRAAREHIHEIPEVSKQVQAKQAEEDSEDRHWARRNHSAQAKQSGKFHDRKHSEHRQEPAKAEPAHPAKSDKLDDRKHSERRQEPRKEDFARPAEVDKGLSKKEKRQQQKQAKKDAATKQKNVQVDEITDEKRTEKQPTLRGAFISKHLSAAGKGDALEYPTKSSSQRSKKTEEHNFAGFGEDWNGSDLRGGSSKKNNRHSRIASNAGPKNPPKPASFAGWDTLQKNAALGIPNSKDQRWDTDSKQSKKSYPAVIDHEHRDFAAPLEASPNNETASLHASAIERALRKSRNSSAGPKTVFAGRGWISPHPLSEAPTRFASPPESAIRGPGVNMSYQEFLQAKAGSPIHSEVGERASSSVRGGASVRSKLSHVHGVTGFTSNYKPPTVESECESKATKHSAANIADKAPTWDKGEAWGETSRRSSKQGNRRGGQTWDQGDAAGSWNPVPQLDGNRSFEDMSAKSNESATPTQSTRDRVDRARRYITAEAARLDREHEVGICKPSSAFLPALMLTIQKILMPKEQEKKKAKQSRTCDAQHTPLYSQPDHNHESTSTISTTAVEGGYTKNSTCSRQCCEKVKPLMTSFDRMQEFNKMKEMGVAKNEEPRNMEGTPTRGPRKYVRKTRTPPMMTPVTSFGSQDTVPDFTPPENDIEESKRRLKALDDSDSACTSSGYEYSIPARTVKTGSTVTLEKTPQGADYTGNELKSPVCGEKKPSDTESGCTPTGFVFTESLHDSDLHETDLRPGRNNPAYNLDGFKMRTPDYGEPLSAIAPSTVMDEDEYWAQRLRDTDSWTVEFERTAIRCAAKAENEKRAAQIAQEEEYARQEQEYARRLAAAAAQDEADRRAAAAVLEAQRKYADEGYSGSPLFLDEYGNYVDAQGNYVGGFYGRPQHYNHHGQGANYEQNAGFHNAGGFAHGNMYYVRKDDNQERQNVGYGQSAGYGGLGGFVQDNMYHDRADTRVGQNAYYGYDAPYGYHSQHGADAYNGYGYGR
ncbi:hypothetical protein MBLNU230_g0484t1 [Neophaeotheca triangularis]